MPHGHSVGKEMGSNPARLQGFSLPCLEQKCVGRPFIRGTRNKLASASSLHSSQIRELNPNFFQYSDLASVSNNSSLPLLAAWGNFSLVSLVWDLFNPNAKMQGMWGAAARDLTRSLLDCSLYELHSAHSCLRGKGNLFIFLLKLNSGFWFSHIKCFDSFCSFV